MAVRQVTGITAAEAAASALFNLLTEDQEAS